MMTALAVSSTLVVMVLLVIIIILIMVGYILFNKRSKRLIMSHAIPHISSSVNSDSCDYNNQGLL